MGRTPEWSQFVGTYKGKKVSVLDVKSFLHKAVRDGEENEAIRWQRVLFEKKARCWKQLLIHCVEDIGLADIGVMDDVLLLKRGFKKRIKRLEMVYREIAESRTHPEWLCIVLATVIVCRARKHRFTDNISIWIKENHGKMPPITQEMWETAKRESKAAIEDIRSGKLPAIPDKALDKHTGIGKKMKRGLEHFKNKASALKNEALEIEDFVPPNWKDGLAK
jgi:hypothetical protein